MRHNLKYKLAEAIATFGYVGYVPKAPGTFGTAAAAIVSWIMMPIIPHNYWTWLWCAMAAVASIIGYLATAYLEKPWGHDPKRIVIDEAAGYWIALAFCPQSMWSIIAVFVVFRLFDISKILGIKHIDNLHTPWSVILDDLVAGIYSIITIRTLLALELITLG